jgi:hypothetical protein
MGEKHVVASAFQSKEDQKLRALFIYTVYININIQYVYCIYISLLYVYAVNRVVEGLLNGRK